MSYLNVDLEIFSQNSFHNTTVTYHVNNNKLTISYGDKDISFEKSIDNFT